MRLIDADAIPWCNYDLDNYHSFVGVDKEYVDEMPTIEAVPLKHIKCRECGSKYVYLACNDCGAKMDLEERNAEE